MPMWRCPHCGTPQAETARCWVCRRSSTTCSTCRHFQRSIAAKVGFCGLDRRHRPLTGAELRGCWVAATSPAAAGPDQAARQTADPGMAHRGFVPVEEVARLGQAAPVPAVLEATDRWADRATLFGDVEA